MLGINSYFKCPNCNYNGIVDLGITRFVSIKNIGTGLAVRDCPNCNHFIAFTIQEPAGINKKYSGNPKVIHSIETAISSLSSEELKNEEYSKDKVLNALISLVGQNYVDKYYGEIIAIVEINLCDKIKIGYNDSYDLTTIPKEDIEITQVICY